MINLKLSKYFTLVLILLSCNYGKYGKLTPSTNPIQKTEFHVFSPSFQKALYKANISFLTKRMGGLMFIKKDSVGNYRMVFTSEVGLTLFDMEWKDSSFLIHKTLPQLEQYGILALIQEDMEILLQTNVSLHEAILLESEKEDMKVAKLPIDEKQAQYYFMLNDQEYIHRIEKSKGRKRKIEMKLTNPVDGAPSSVWIKHNGVNLQIELNKMEQ